MAWDPLSKYVASLSSDRTCRIYVNKPQKAKGVERMNYACQHVIVKTEQQSADDTKVSNGPNGLVIGFILRDLSIIDKH